MAELGAYKTTGFNRETRGRLMQYPLEEIFQEMERRILANKAAEARMKYEQQKQKR